MPLQHPHQQRSSKMRVAIVLSLVAMLFSVVSAESLCFGRPSFLGSTCAAECSVRGHHGGSYSNGQCCCGASTKRSEETHTQEEDLKSAEDFFGGKLLMSDDDSLEVHNGPSVSRVSCSACNIKGFNGGGLCCKASCATVGKPGGYCNGNDVCVCK